jgi:hypothetical protein
VSDGVWVQHDVRIDEKQRVAARLRCAKIARFGEANIAVVDYDDVADVLSAAGGGKALAQHASGFKDDDDEAGAHAAFLSTRAIAVTHALHRLT